MGGFDLTAGLIVQLFVLQSLNLCFGEDNGVVLGDFVFQCFQPLFEVGKIMPEPDGTHTRWRDRSSRDFYNL